ncbi:MAG: pyruvate dehydrogenase (acetyl-transferring) E1 component subunit alpha, partial [Pseudolysinimonas sp.]
MPESPRETVRLLDEDGVRTPSAEWDTWIDDLDAEALASLYEDMVVLRRIDAEATALQRQGEIALWPPVLGQ